MSGCLVTDEVSFDNEEINVPPVILDVQSSKTRIGDIIFFDVETPATITFEFRVRDENLGQPLRGRRKIYLQVSEDFSPEKETSSFPIAPSYEPIRKVSFDITEDSFNSDKCYRIDLAVSSGFKYPSDDIQYALWDWDTPEDDEDIAKAKWYVVTGKGEEAQCQYRTEYE